MADVINAEVKSVRDLKHAMSRYSEDLRAATSAIRRQATVIERQTAEAVEQRRRRHQQVQAEVRDAEEALARSPEERSRECERALREARQRSSAAAQRLDVAVRAERQTTEAMHNLSRIVGVVEAAVADHSSASASALLELEVKLSEITSGGAAAVAKNALVTLATAAQVIGTGADVAKLAGNVSQGALPTAEQITSTPQLQEWAADRDEQAWAESELARRKREAGRVVDGNDAP